jgi:ribonucleoside-diphosphate reductase alpha chain
MDINHNLVKDLKNMGLWEKVRDQIIELQGDISSIEEVPQHVKDVYKTAFTTSAYAYIEVAARAQKWVDQALSRNMYLETRDIDETMKIYETAWRKGLKSTYYLHMKPRHTAEQSTVKVNKSEKLGKIGFAAVANKIAPKGEELVLQKEAIPTPMPAILPTVSVAVDNFVKVPSAIAPKRDRIDNEQVETVSSPIGMMATKQKPNVCPVDPAERALCDACQ